MLHQITRKAGKLPVALIIISLCLFSADIYSQVDTAKIRKDIANVLKKNGLKDATFELKVTSSNQHGGQTALIINNYNGQTLHVINGNNNTVGINGDVNINRDLKLTDEYLLWIYRYTDSFRIASGTAKNLLVSTKPYCNAPLVAGQIVSFFEANGYTVEGNGISFPSPDEKMLHRFAIGPFANKGEMLIEIGYFDPND